ncbi:MAG: leucine-rich repeat protein, partial [Mycoplasmataceae bacterium]|nr:leucine-rich repeat protein [Mycoplasmataceae bacterium]
GSIILPTTVTYIGDYAFDGCNQITGLTIPSSVKYIGSCAFKDCSSIANRVVIPNEITEILPSTFQGCSKLTEVTLSNKLTKIGQNAFNNCVKLANILLPDSLVEIDNYAFNSCTSLTKVDVSNHVTRIGSYSFQSCTGLTDVNVADSVELIDKYAFYGCSNLTNVIINEETSNLTKIGDYAFCYASKLKIINFPKKLESIGQCAFQYDTSFVGTPKIPESVTEIGLFAFAGTGCNTKTTWGFNVAYSYEGEGYAKWLLTASFVQEIPNFAIEKNTIGIAGGTFYNSTGTAGQLVLGGTDNRTLKYIGDSAFFYNDWSSIYGLEYTQVKTIGDSAFNLCNDLLGTIRLPNTIESIGTRAFANTTFSSLAIDQDTTRTTKCTIGQEAFLNSSSLSGTLNIPTYVNEIGKDAFKGCTALTKDASNIVYSSEDQIGFNKWCIGIVNGTTTLNSLQFDSNVYGIAGGAFTGNTSLGKIIVGDNIEVIGDSAFKECTNLSAVDLGHGKLKTIGNSAFHSCTSLSTNPLNQESQKSLESIDDYAFEGCTNMSGTLTLGNANENKLLKIGTAAFANCSNLSGKLEIYGANGLDLSGSRIFVNCSGLNSVEIFNDSIKTIGNGIFNGCSKIEKI